MNEGGTDDQQAGGGRTSHDADIVDGPWISSTDRETLAGLLQQLGFIAQDERIEALTRAGEGNMNCTLRVMTDRRRFIVKQSRPWVEKYPSIAAPVNRIDFERRFYEAANKWPTIAERMPKLLAAFPQHRMIVLEDLGQANDGSALYTIPPANDSLPAWILQLVDWLAELHQASQLTPTAPDATTTILRHRNLELRQLNHAHLFVIPLAEPAALALDAITPGLETIRCAIRQQSDVARAVQKLGERYLADGNFLLHGDFFPGSWLLCDDGPRVIDPEFSFYGDAEFDVAVLVAHLRLIGYSADTAFETVKHYETRGVALRTPWVRGWAGVEIIRRLLGVAQLPADWSLAEKQARLDDAVAWLQTFPD